MAGGGPPKGMKVGYRISGRGTVEAVTALDPLKPLGSLVWNTLQSQ